MKPKIWKIWVGENPIPDHFKKYTGTWSKIDAEIVEVNNNTVKDILPNVNFKALCEHFHWNNTVINHWLRYFLMYQYGGIYLDLDVEVIKDSEIWYSKEPIFFAETEHPLWVNNHVMVCNTKNKDVYHNLVNKVWIHNMNDPKVEINTGPGLVTETILHPECSHYICDSKFTTPWNWNEKPDRSRITENTIAVHHFAHSWKK